MATLKPCPGTQESVWRPWRHLANYRVQGIHCGASIHCDALGAHSWTAMGEHGKVAQTTPNMPTLIPKFHGSFLVCNGLIKWHKTRPKNSQSNAKTHQTHFTHFNLASSNIHTIRNSTLNQQLKLPQSKFTMLHLIKGKEKWLENYLRS